jgi:putative membrane protein
MDPYIPFCGLPPLPADLWSRWTLDAALLVGLALLLAVGLRVAEHRPRFALGWGIAALLFVSPICAASMALFSARVGQHIALTLLAAPILAAALPALRLPALPLAGLFAVLFWTWHAPAPYQATLESDLAYWAMHISLVGSAVLLFSALRAAPMRGLAAAGLTGAQMTLYAMLLTLSPSVWHGWHLATTAPYGLTALADQQLAGGLMWVAGGGLFMACIAVTVFRLVRAEQPEPRAPISR